MTFVWAAPQARAGLGEGAAAYNAGNFKLAYEEFLKVAERGDARAQYNLGVMSYKGQGVPQDYQAALWWYRQAADQGLAEAQYNLGVMYYKGKGIKPDTTEAVRWYRQAADQGLVEAQNNLGVMYNKGQGVPRDHQAAVRWYRKAADQGHAVSQYNLGAMYDIGEGVPRNYIEAYMWYSLAAAQSHDDATHSLDLLEKVMTLAQVAVAQERTQNWRPSSSGRNDEQKTEPSNGIRHPVATGSGFLAGPAGHILTNHHVVEGCDSVHVSPPETVAKVIAHDTTNDLALLSIRVDSGIAPVSFRAEPVRLGETVVVAGYPLHGLVGQGLNVTQGEVSALSGLRGDSRHLQITAPVQPGNSGGPLLDGAGRVAGVVVGKLNALGVAVQTGDIPQNINFAIRSGIVRAFLDAHAVPYRASSDGKLRSTETIAETARGYTVLVECWQ